MNKEVSENKYKKRKKGNTFFIVVCFLLTYIFLQMYLVNSNKVDTVKALHGYINDSIICQGIVAREEKVLEKSSAGAVDYLIQNGERVSVGYQVAQVYPTYEDLDNVLYLKNREETLNDIINVESYINGNVLDISNTRKELSSQMSSLATSSITNNYYDILDELTQISVSLNKIGVATGRITDFSQAKAQTESEISTVKAVIPSATDTLTSPYTGYFLKKVDGYENVITVDNLLNMSYDEGIQLMQSNNEYEKSDNAYGKVITNYRWNVCTYLEPEQAKRLYEGQNVKISLQLNSNQYHKAVVKKIVEKGDKFLVVIECTTMDEIAATERITDCEILFKQYNGIKIPKTALKFDSEQNMGVYVTFSNTVSFKKISPVYENEDYVVVPIENSSANQVKLYDSIIVKGRNLYDGKYL